MQAYPEYFKPIIGWAMQRLRKGDSLEQVDQRIAIDQRFGFLTTAQRKIVLDAAVVNHNASCKAEIDPTCQKGITTGD